MVHASLTHVEGLLAPERGFAVLTSSIPTVALSMDHLCLLWCHQLLTAVAQGLDKMLDPKTNRPYASPTNRVKAFEQALLPATMFPTSMELLQALHYGYAKHEARLAEVYQHSYKALTWVYLYGASIVSLLVYCSLRLQSI